jgi:hypothetical protein
MVSYLGVTSSLARFAAPTSSVPSFSNAKLTSAMGKMMAERGNKKAMAIT